MGKPSGQRLSGRQKIRWEDHIKMNIRAADSEDGTGFVLCLVTA